MLGIKCLDMALALHWLLQHVHLMAQHVQSYEGPKFVSSLYCRWLHFDFSHLAVRAEYSCWRMGLRLCITLVPSSIDNMYFTSEYDFPRAQPLPALSIRCHCLESTSHVSMMLDILSCNLAYEPVKAGTLGSLNLFHYERVHTCDCY